MAGRELPVLLRGLALIRAAAMLRVSALVPVPLLIRAAALAGPPAVRLPGFTLWIFFAAST